MQVKGGKEVTLTPGQTFYEGPKDVHVVSRNASKTTPAKFLVFFVKDKAAPVLASEVTRGVCFPIALISGDGGAGNTHDRQISIVQQMANRQLGR